MPIPAGSCSKKWLSAPVEVRASVCNCFASIPWLDSICASHSYFVNSPVTPETSVPTYMKSAIAKSQNEGLRKSSLAPLNEDDSGCEGRGKRGTSISANSTTVMPPSDQKIEASPPYC